MLLQVIRSDGGHLDLEVVQAEFTLGGGNPALDQFTDLARQLRQEAEAQARHHGRAFSAAVPGAMGRLKPVPAGPRPVPGS